MADEGYRTSTIYQMRIGEPKSKSGYSTIPLTEEAVEILKLQKQKNCTFKVIPMEWADIVFRNHNEFVCSYHRRAKI